MKTVADLHTHTSACPHGHCTRQELILRAKERGLWAVGISEHVQAWPDGVPMTYFEEMNNWLTESYGVRVLRGVESDISDWRGKIFMQRRYMKNLDYVIASLHRHSLWAADRLTVTRTWCGIAEDPAVDIIGHCGRDPDRFDFETDTVIRAFRDGGKTVEFNESSFGKPEQEKKCYEICEACGKYGVPVMIGSDSHYARSVGASANCIRMIETVGLPEELIINADRDRLEKWLASVKERKSTLFD